jgi:serine protease inhibitor
MLDSLIQGDAASMFILLPDELEGIKNLESGENVAVLTRNFTDVKYAEINVTLPKFKIETSLDLKSNLMQVRLEQHSNTSPCQHYSKGSCMQHFVSKKVHYNSITIYPISVF